MTLTKTTIADKATWNNLLATLPYAHILQTWDWGAFKEATTGWKPLRIAWQQNGETVAMASVGVRKVGLLRVMYVPKGPAMDYANHEITAKVLDDLENLAQQQRAIWLKIDPDVVLATGEPQSEDDQTQPLGTAFVETLKTRGWRFSDDQVQFRNTVKIDLTQDEDTILAAMSQNTRRKVRTAAKKGVIVREATFEDLPLLYELYQITGARDAFLIRPFDYYKRAWEDFMRAGLAHALIAEYQGQALGMVILFHFGRTCWYFYGASSNEERQRMPNYALQWEAMRWAKANGYEVYDMWGAPNVFDESDSMWGVYQFKRGFRGEVVRHVGAWDYAPNALLYQGYAQLWPKLRALLRKLRG